MNLGIDVQEFEKQNSSRNIKRKSKSKFENKNNVIKPLPRGVKIYFMRLKKQLKMP